MSWGQIYTQGSEMALTGFIIYLF